MLPQIGPAEIIVILLVALMVFGPHRLPEVGRQVGSAMRQLKKLQENIRGEINEVLHSDDDSLTISKNTKPDVAVETFAPVPSIQVREPERPAAGRAPSRYRAPDTRTTN